MRRAMIRSMKVLRALEPLSFVPPVIAIAYLGASVVIWGRLEYGAPLPGPDWIYWVVFVLPWAISFLFVFFIAGSLVIDIFLGRRSRRRAQDREVRQIVEALRIKPAQDPGISHTALVRSVQGRRSLVDGLIRGLVDSGELECVQKGRVRRYFVEPARAEIENAGAGPTTRPTIFRQSFLR